MLQRTQQRRELSYNGPDELHWTNGAAPRRMDLHDIYTFVKSNWRIIAAWTIVALALALGYAFTATPLYTATVELALEFAESSGTERASGRRQLTQFVAG